MDLTEKCLESREIYKGRILRLRVDTVALPNGKTSLREIVEHPGGVGILALDENGCVPMVTSTAMPSPGRCWRFLPESSLPGRTRSRPRAASSSRRRV